MGGSDEEERKLDRENCWEKVETGEMPPWFYVYPMHLGARLSEADKALLKSWMLKDSDQGAGSEVEHAASWTRARRRATAAPRKNSRQGAGRRSRVRRRKDRGQSVSGVARSSDLVVRPPFAKPVLSSAFYLLFQPLGLLCLGRIAGSCGVAEGLPRPGRADSRYCVRSSIHRACCGGSALRVRRWA